MTDARHTPAADFLASQGDDMFSSFKGDSPCAQTSADDQDLITFEGVLTRNAEVRSTTAADGLHSIPSVCLELLSISGHGKQDKRTCYAQIPFTDATRSDAEACAKRHKKGMVIKVLSPVLQTRLVLPAAEIINAYSPS